MTEVSADSNNSLTLAVSLPGSLGFLLSSSSLSSSSSSSSSESSLFDSEASDPLK